MKNDIRSRIDSALATRADLGPLALRAGLGAVFLAHGYAKISVFTLPGTVKFFEAFGLPGWAAYPVTALELAAGAALVLGFQTRLAAAALVPVMLGALLPHLGNGWMFTGNGGGWEYPALLVVALVAQVFLGSGALSLTRERARAPRGHELSAPEHDRLGHAATQPARG